MRPMPTSPPKRGGWLACIAAAVLVFGGGYAAAYWWLMEPVPVWRIGHSPTYPHPALENVFAPAHWLDRRIRPDLWEPWF